MFYTMMFWLLMMNPANLNLMADGYGLGGAPVQRTVTASGYAVGGSPVQRAVAADGYGLGGVR
ncbi:MAG: hypothetical protein HYR56_07460 [Acidobacteria bacterium]|nr:hypothetical protein [Acidobacteriota bacterium]MBI3427260.1 hypothetical protein [Acidobacteriota bacterium]